MSVLEHMGHGMESRGNLLECQEFFNIMLGPTV